MNNTFRCDRCKKVMIGEEYDSHLCTPIPVDAKTIYIDYYHIIKDQLGRTVILTKGLNGIIYRLIKRDCKSSDKTPISDENLQPS
jgi:hypothetical protein